MTNPTEPTFRHRQGTGGVGSLGWKQMSLRVSPETHQRIKAAAAAENIPDIDFVRAAITEKLERDEAKA